MLMDVRLVHKVPGNYRLPLFYSQQDHTAVIYSRRNIIIKKNPNYTVIVNK